MLVLGSGAGERTEGQFRTLLGETGFSLTRVTNCGYVSIIESQPV
jgi:hypothetical protein